jgi:PST family polysaccharide transporter
MDRFSKFISIGMNTLGTQILMFLGISLMAKSQGVEFVGYQALTFSIASYLFMIIQLGFQTQGLKLIIEGFNFRGLFFSFTKVKIYLYSIVLIITMVLYLLEPTDNKKGVLLLLLVGGVSIINSEFYLQFKERFLVVGLSRLISGAVFLSVCIYIYNRSHVEIGSLISILPYALFLLVPQLFLIYFYRNGVKESRGMKFQLDKNIFKQSVVIAIGLLVVQLGYRADKVMISWLLDIYSLGIYDTAYKFLNVALNVAFILYFVLAKNIKKLGLEYYHKTLVVFSICALLGGLSLYVLAPILIEIFFGESFKESVILLRLLIIPLLFMVVNVAMISPMNLFGLEGEYLFLVSISTGINIISNWLLISSYGIYGSVYAMIISELVMVVLFLLFFYSKLRGKLY